MPGVYKVDMGVAAPPVPPSEDKKPGVGCKPKTYHRHQLEAVDVTTFTVKVILKLHLQCPGIALAQSMYLPSSLWLSPVGVYERAAEPSSFSRDLFTWPF